MADEFEQGGVAGFGHDFVVEFPCFFPGQKLGRGFAGRALKNEAAQRRLVGHGDNHLCFEPATGGVGETDLHRGGCHLLDDVHGDVDGGNRHRSGRFRRDGPRLRNDDVGGVEIRVRVLVNLVGRGGAVLDLRGRAET